MASIMPPPKYNGDNMTDDSMTERYATASEPQTDNKRRMGEVMDASTSEFTAQCYRLYDAPEIGSLVMCGQDAPVYGIVYEATTQSIDPGRAAFPRGMHAESEADVLHDNPQIERLLCTKFSAVVVGYRDGDAVRRYPPLIAPRIFSFVRECDDDELAEFSSSHEFLTLLLAAPIGSQDHVIASFLRRASAAHADSHDYLVSAGKNLATMLPGQLQRLSGILRSLA